MRGQAAIRKLSAHSAEVDIAILAIERPSSSIPRLKLQGETSQHRLRLERHRGRDRMRFMSNIDIQTGSGTGRVMPLYLVAPPGPLSSIGSITWSISCADSASRKPSYA
jgi:hypothetical protein